MLHNGKDRFREIYGIHSLIQKLDVNSEIGAEKYVGTPIKINKEAIYQGFYMEYDDIIGNDIEEN